MTTTTPAKPRRRRAKRAVRQPATVTMNQQSPLKVEVPTSRVDRVKPDVQLITRQQYWSDFQARLQIHDYEFAEAMSDLKTAASWTNEQIKKLIKRIETVELK